MLPGQCLQDLAGVGVPDSHRPGDVGIVHAARGQAVPVGTERHTPRLAGVPGAEGLAGVGVPQPHRVVTAAAGQPVTVGAERHTPHRVGVAR